MKQAVIVGSGDLLGGMAFEYDRIKCLATITAACRVHEYVDKRNTVRQWDWILWCILPVKKLFNQIGKRDAFVIEGKCTDSGAGVFDVPNGKSALDKPIYRAVHGLKHRLLELFFVCHKSKRVMPPNVPDQRPPI